MQRDILEIAADQLGNSEPSITLDALFDAALRSLRPLPPGHPRSVEVLNIAMDRLYRVLTEGETAREGQGASPRVDRVCVTAKVPRPALRP